MEVDRLRLLASAIGGRTLEVGAAEVGESPWTDGTTLYVDAAAPPSEQVRQVAVQASLLAAGSLDPAIVGRLTRRSALARRYLAVEGHRALLANEAVLPPTARGLVDRAIGAGVADAAASLAVARHRPNVAHAPATFGEIRPRRLLATATRGPAEADSGPARLRAEGTTTLRPLKEDDDAGDDERYVGQLLTSPVGGQGVVGRLLRRMLTAARAPGGGGPAGADAPTHVGRARPGGRTPVTPAGAPPELVEVPAALRPRAYTYPEWDAHRRRYRPDWCTVHEREVRPEDEASRSRPLPDGRALRRPLARLGAGLVRVARRPEGDEVHVDAAVEARVAVLAGAPADDAVYVETLRRRRDLAVLVLLDVSGSAGEPGPGGRTVHEHQREAAAALTTALHDLGDRVALHAFRSQGRTAVHLTRVKGFDDRLDDQVARRLGGLVPGAYTRLGAAIRHGASVLEERGGTSRRLLLVLSDGFAYDHGYGGDYGEADARRALTEARRRGLGCLCLSVGAATTPVALRRVFGPAAHASVATADELPDVVGPLFRAALLSAAAERRTFQRK